MRTDSLVFRFSFLLSCWSSVTRCLADNEVMVLAALKRAYPDWIPEAIIDVGANKGGWTTKAKELFPSPAILMLEATEKHRPRLEAVKSSFSPNVEFRIDLLAAHDNEVIKFFQGKDTGNSIFKEQTKFYANDVAVERIAVTLDTAVADVSDSLFKDKHLDYLKLDVQGAELLVLQGGTKVLEQVTFVQLEVSLVAYNAGGVCWSEVDGFLRRRGFRLYDIGDIVRNPSLLRTPAAGQMDVLYVRPDSERLPNVLKERETQFCNPQALPSEEGSPQTPTAGEKEGTETKNTGDEYLKAMEARQQAALFVFVFVVGFIVGRAREKMKNTASEASSKTSRRRFGRK